MATKKSDGIVVWDHKGLVIVWPDGHHSRFSWVELRQVCHCAECRHQQEQRPGSCDPLYNYQETTGEV
ncbi:MAG: gamma-butyrobetaine hydroxylase-like domain-containing protein [Candidatus Binatia bacterium]